ncbi:MAG TPA: DNA recombination protein RmuC [Dinghuibacter sp.]|uniref:DNA recombination protein RmuC n=1 Tax=Dinghuibacter sp. TaxID=2024697 RepID=UPI002B6053B1|nr:DNA recombination protein RmuC [Dinghuibacter sp.]HTJ13891.1 DNA recombination protein RmuC [Dinghuibacter sp.]
MNDILFLILGIALGGVIGWFWMKGRAAIELATANAARGAANEALLEKNQEIKTLKDELSGERQRVQRSEQQLARAEAENRALEKSLKTQAMELERLNQRFITEFENVANKILDSKTDKFTQLNKINMTAILEPLGKTITEFREQINTESKQRFSLGEKVKELADLNQQLSKDAQNLARALKTESKTQGRWGEVVLESILEKSGLRKDEEYFMESQLYGPDGQPLRNEARGTKLRPDAIIKYPDDRHVIIDAKVSINAFVRATEAVEPVLQQAELAEHVRSVKEHIQELENRAYDDYHKTLDFVMMFIPSEAAYIAALQVEPDLWNFAYGRRILLTSPSSLIISLKLIVDLWKREYQNLNARAIAERGSKLYDKFVGFVTNLQGVGLALDNARSSYDEAYKQLNTGRDNLVLQATKLKALGVKTKRELPDSLANSAPEIDNGEVEE